MVETNSVAAALSRVTESAQAAEDAAAIARKSMEAEYPQLLARSHEPKKGDAERLAEIIAGLSLDPSRVRRDAEIVSKARENIARAGTDAEASRAYSAAVKSRAEMVKRHKQELEEADRELSAAGLKKEQVSNAKTSLRSLAAERPEFFGRGLLEVPEGMAMPAPRTASPRPRPEVIRQVFTINVGTRWDPNFVEPVLNEDGVTYARNARGHYLMPSGEYRDRGGNLVPQTV